MHDLIALGSLLDVLNKHGVRTYKALGLELTLSGSSSPGPLPSPVPTEVQQVPILESELPPDLRADDLMDQDKILNWSSPDAEGDMPLTMDSP